MIKPSLVTLDAMENCPKNRVKTDAIETDIVIW